MASGKHRSASQKVRDRLRVSELYLEGRYQHEIAEKLDISIATVCRDLKALRQQWIESALVDTNEAKNRELSKIDNLERTYWEGWLRSCEDEVVTTEKIIDSGEGEPRTETTVRRKAQAGDTKFLDGVDKCVKQRCKILGVEAPTEHEAGPRLTTILSALPDALKAGVLASLTDGSEEGK